MEETPTISTVFTSNHDPLLPGATDIITSSLPTSTAAPSSKSPLNTVESRWSHSDDSVPTPLPVTEPMELNEIKTETVKRPLTRVMSPPPHYSDYWKGDNEDYEVGVRGTGGEPSGSQYYEPHYSDPKGKGKARDDYGY
ncbi:hypothetical protein NW766_008817 [Fusarium irregulare]|uniref:Uncharacterized protein n=1 Tax=Fusarium irregulare TaxID=2494466 RepID=A0A9W8PKE2_9HYPO|nr:hypothetical protein NW766_008817 [Fusarium irregulare]